jgi:hypothetical protein
MTVIGAFPMAYNDAIDDERRQDLYAIASRVVGSNATRRVREARAAWPSRRSSQPT